MPGLEDLYREIILDHYRNPRNRGELPAPPAHVETGFNPLCGDEITLFVQVDGDRLADIKLTGQGCSISQSSASMMSIHEHRLDGSDEPDEETTSDGEISLGDLEALQGVVKFPVRIKCATLSWNTLAQALDELSPASSQ
jgi:nitrogen fixation NifU-like protein